MGVGHEARVAQRLFAHAQQRRDVERLELGVNGHAVALAQERAEADRRAIEQDQLDLGVRNAERLDHVLGGGGAGAGHGELAPPPLGGEEIVQLLVEAESRRHHARHQGSPPAASSRTGMRRRPKPGSIAPKRPATRVPQCGQDAAASSAHSQHLVPVAPDQRFAAAGAVGGAALDVVHVAGVDVMQAVGERDARGRAAASRAAWQALSSIL